MLDFPSMRGFSPLRRSRSWQPALVLALATAALWLLPPRNLVWCRAGECHAAIEDALEGCCTSPASGEDEVPTGPRTGQAAGSASCCEPGGCTDVHLPRTAATRGDAESLPGLKPWHSGGDGVTGSPARSRVPSRSPHLPTTERDAAIRTTVLIV